MAAPADGTAPAAKTDEPATATAADELTQAADQNTGGDDNDPADDPAGGVALPKAAYAMCDHHYNNKPVSHAPHEHACAVRAHEGPFKAKGVNGGCQTRSDFMYARIERVYCPLCSCWLCRNCHNEQNPYSKNGKPRKQRMGTWTYGNEGGK